MIRLYNTELKPQRAFLIAANTNEYDVETSLQELKELAETAGAEVVGMTIQNLPTINNATYIGKGKLLEVKEYCEQQDVEMLIFDDELSGAQIRNIEDETGMNVIDRTMLILDIFALRALSNEGKLQVELAQQKYLLPRLYGLGSQLSRQGGGIGTRGPGETKLESDKRHIRRRIESLEQELKELEKRRDNVRKRRQKNDVITIAIVGYTNVGKSTLLNLLTDAGVLAKNQLFATLDPTARELKLKDGQSAVIIDTVGLIQRLPHQLVQAFKSTLEEAANADIILNVCDISNENVDIQIKVTKELLDELGCGDIPIITVCNKIDKVNREALSPMNNRTVFISAQENIGIDDLLDCIAAVLADSTRRMNLLIPYAEGSLLDRIRRQGKILSEEYQENGTLIDAILDIKMVQQVEQYIIK
ncbi:GTPase HflX [Paludicola sp. MB14-C6]|nr:GTPase HflX [Paludicola sp. MB14-C6]WMJ24428.1 GTPase HflX [Paludicola sp. MB14-C6]